MEGAGHIQTQFFPMGTYWEKTINEELKSGKRSRINRGIVLHYMIERAAKMDGWFANDQPLQKGECIISREKVAKDCHITTNQARGAIEWLEDNHHILRTEHEGVPASVGTFYLITGLISPTFYEGTYKNTKAKDAKKADNTGIIDSSGGEKPPDTQQKPPGADDAKKPCLSTLFEDGEGVAWGENNQNNNIGYPVGNSNTPVYNSYKGPKPTNRANFEQFKTKDHLKNYILSATHRSKKERSKYDCPFCGSGKGKNGTGALSIDNRRGGTSWRCFSCGLHGDIFDFAGYLNDTSDKFKQLQIVSQFFNGSPLFLPR